MTIAPAVVACPAIRGPNWTFTGKKDRIAVSGRGESTAGSRALGRMAVPPERLA